MIVETSGWRHLKEENKLFLSYEYQKMYHPSQEMAQLPQVPQIKNGKSNFSPTFQKVELRNSTFFPIINIENLKMKIPKNNVLDFYQIII